MIDYVEIRSTSSRAVLGLVDTAKSIIWNVTYYGVGDFELYVKSSSEMLQLLSVGNYVTRYGSKDVGIIESITVSDADDDGEMITAAGRFAKSMLSRRLIYDMDANGKTIYPVVSSGNVETAVRKLVNDNIINAADAARRISFIELGALAGITKRIVDENGVDTSKQTSFENLLDYTDNVLHEYEIGAFVGMDRNTQKLQYTVFDGVDRSQDNTAGNIPLVFSQDFDNLLSREYFFDKSAIKNTALIGGEGEGTLRFCAMMTGSETGAERREVFIDAGSQSLKYKDAGGIEHTYTDAQYTALLKAQAAQELAHLVTVETLVGNVDITNSGLVYGTDFAEGDLVTVQDNTLNKYTTERITAVTEVQDDDGYSINIEFGE